MSTDKVNFKIVSMGKGAEGRVPSNFKPLTVEKVLMFIESKQMDPQVKSILKDMAQNYPKNALGNWIRNFSKHVARAQKMIALDPKKYITDIVEKQPDPNNMSLPEENEFD